MGQAESRVQFISRGAGATLLLAATEAVWAVETSLPPSPGKRRANTEPQTLRLAYAGGNSGARLVGLEPLPGSSHYFLGNDPTQWRTGVPNYARVRYPDVYPGVSLEYYSRQGQIECDFVVAPGADPANIILEIDGAKRLDISAQGELRLVLPKAEVRLHKPVAYQVVNGARRLIRSAYARRGQRRIGFQIGAYDARRPLVIDPVLSYSTHLGGSSSDTGWSVAVDAAGNAYVAGRTLSTNFPTNSPFQAARGGGTDERSIIICVEER